MPTMDHHQSAEANKVLVMAKSGDGKTGCTIGSLANAGYRCFVLDYDNGLDVLRDPKVLRPENRKNVIFKTLTDKVGAGGKLLAPPQAAQAGLMALEKWTDEGQDYGSIYTWGPQDCLFLDTLTFFGSAVLRWVLHINNQSGKAPQIQHWGEAMRIQEEVLAQLYSNAIKCNVIVNAHITYRGQGDDEQAFPSALGDKLPPKVAGYFNSVLGLRKRPRGQGVFEFKLLTQGTTSMALKCPKPSVVPAEMDADLAKYFALLKNDTPAAPMKNPERVNEGKSASQF